MTTRDQKFESQILLYAARSGDVSAIKDLLGSGADVNIANGDGETPLMFAVYRGDLNLVEYLLRIGANPNCQVVEKSSHNVVISEPDRGLTPLKSAVLANRLDLVSLLLKSGADPNLRDWSGNTALMREVERSVGKSIRA